MQSPANLKLISRNLKIMFDALRVLLLFAFFLFLFSTERISLLSWVKNYPFVGYYCLGKNEKTERINQQGILMLFYVLRWRG